MPKLAKSEEEQRNLEFRALVEKNMVLQGVDTKPELAQRIGRSSTALYRKLRAPGTFTVEELRRLYKILHFTKEEKEVLL